MSEKTIFEACAEAVAEATDNNLSFDEDRKVVRAVLQRVIDLTPSLRTIEELGRIVNSAVVNNMDAGLHEDGEVMETKPDSAQNTLCDEATGSYQPGFGDRFEVLQMCNGDAGAAQRAWTWLTGTNAA